MAKLPGVSRAAPTPCPGPISAGASGSESAQERGECEPGRADLEQPAAAVTVAQRTSQQQQPGQGQGIGVRHPLQLADTGVERRPMVGRAMPTTVASMLAMAEPSTVAATTQRPRPNGRRERTTSWPRPFSLPGRAGAAARRVVGTSGLLVQSPRYGAPIWTRPETRLGEVATVTTHGEAGPDQEPKWPDLTLSGLGRHATRSSYGRKSWARYGWRWSRWSTSGGRYRSMSPLAA